MAVFLSPIGNEQIVDANGAPLSGGTIETYLAGTSTPATTYTTNTGMTAHANPIVLNTLGLPNSASSAIWLTGGLAYKFVIKNSSGVLQRTIDNLSGIGDTASTADEWVLYNATPTYISATSFSVAGDQTNIFQINRRIKTVNSGGLVYSTVTAASFAAGITTVTVANTSGAIDSGLSAVSYGLLSAINGSVPASLPNLISTPFVADVQDFRLTLTAGVPITTSDVTGATTIYASPLRGKSIALFDGTSLWNVRQSAEFSIALGTLTSGRPYDVFCYDNAGVPTLEILSWTNTTTRTTALTRQDGIYVKSGATTRRYLGTFYTTSTTTTEDSSANRFLWNYYNQVDRIQSVIDTTDSWTYTTATWRQARGSAANKFSAVIGVAETLVEIDVHISVTTTGAGGTAGVGAGVGIDSTTTNSAVVFGGHFELNSSGQNCDAKYRGYPAVGYHDFNWLEISTATVGTTTFWGDGGAVSLQSGMVGKLRG